MGVRDGGRGWGRQGGPACGTFHDGLDTGPGQAALSLGTVSTAGGSPPAGALGRKQATCPSSQAGWAPLSQGLAWAPRRPFLGRSCPL